MHVKRLAKKMIQGVDVTLAAATVNEIFCCHNEKSQSVFDGNKNTVINEIKNLDTNHPELKRPITDALRVFIQANFMLSGKMQDNFEEIFNIAIERNIFIKSGEKTEPKRFLEMTEKLIQKYNVK